MSGDSAGGRAVLVPGGAGYIGSHACKALRRAGFVPVAVDNLVHGHRRAVRWGPFEHADIGDGARLREILAAHRPVAVMHFAAYAYVGESVQHPARYWRNNVAATLELLEAMRAHDLRMMVFSSTCATYGEPGTDDIAESVPQNPVNPYGAGKLAVERILADYDRAYGLRSVALRYFNAAGADPEGEIGEAHDPETHLIPLALAATSPAAPPLRIFGQDYPTPDGTAIRDYVHVADLAAAHVRALGHLLGGGATTALNLGTGRGHSVREVVAAIERVTGRRVNAVASPRRPGDPPRLVADARRAQAELGFAAPLSSIDTIIETAWRWHLGRTQPGRGRVAAAS